MAINFPDSPSNGTTHTAAGVTWTYDGTTWKASGSTASYTLPTASATVLGGVKVGTNLSINGSGVLSASGGEITVQEEGSSLATAATTLNFVGGNVTATGTGATKTITISAGIPSDLGINATARVLYQAGNGNTDILPAGNSGEVLTSGGSGVVPSWSTVSSGATRTTANGTTASIANNTAADLTIAAAKTYVLHEIQVDKAAWVTLYTDTASRTADANRTELEDPAAGAGIIAEVVTTGGVSQKLTPGTVGFNLDGTPSTNVYLKVVNKSGSTGTVQGTLKYLALEA